MGLFATLGRKHASTGNPAPGVVDGLEPLPRGSHRFEAVVERLRVGEDVGAACALAGRDLARDGVDLGEALDGLRAAVVGATGVEPVHDAVRALCVAWGEETLGFVHQVSCEDPLTGLASRGHLRARLSELYRAAEQRGTTVTAGHALVVLDLPLLAAPGSRAVGGWDSPLDRALGLARVAETVRMVFPGDAVVGETGATRVVALVDRGDLLARRVGLLRGLVEDLGGAGAGSRVWIEGLPANDTAAGWLLDELARA